MDDVMRDLAMMRLWYGDPRQIVPMLALARSARPKAEGDAVVIGSDDYGEGIAVARLANGIAMVHLNGPMMPYASFYGTDTRATASLIDSLAADDSILGIMLDVDSPGGDVDGTDDLAIAVRAAKARKPVAAHVASIGASAAYYVASQADVLTTGRTAMVGSIGVYALMLDDTRMWEDMGIKWTLVSSGGVKGAGSPGQPLRDEEIAETQAIVDRFYGFFVEAVAQGRGMDEGAVRAIEQGRMFAADEAMEMGMSDGTMTRGEAIAALHQRAVAARREQVQRAATIARVRGGF